jgi:hypothetical protein
MESIKCPSTGDWVKKILVFKCGIHMQWTITWPLKRKNCFICSSMGGIKGHYVKRDVRFKRQMLHVLNLCRSYKVTIIDAENRVIVTRAWEGCRRGRGEKGMVTKHKGEIG